MHADAPKCSVQPVIFRFTWLFVICFPSLILNLIILFVLLLRIKISPCQMSFRSHLFSFDEFEMRYLFIFGTLWFILVLLQTTSCWKKFFSPKYSQLRHYNVDPKSVSVSGISNGAGMAVHIGFIYSSLIHHVGVFSGAPYPIAHMVYNKQFTDAVNIKKYIEHVERWSDEGLIDSVENLRTARVFVFHGIKDIMVPQIFNYMLANEFYYFGASVKTEIATVLAGHCVPTDTCCNYLPQLGSAQAVCDAGYQGVNYMFQHFYGRYFKWPKRNDAKPTGFLFKFDQNEFFPDHFAEGFGLASAAFIYVPKLCELGKVRCKLHVAIHGYGLPLAARIAGDGHNEFVQDAGYLQAADASNIIVIFPETVSLGLGWDFIGFYGKNYSFKNGTHVFAIANMIKRIVYGH